MNSKAKFDQLAVMHQYLPHDPSSAQARPASLFHTPPHVAPSHNFSSVLSTSGSRLPAPFDWFLRDTPPGDSAAGASGLGGAFLLALACETTATQLLPGVGSERLVKSLLEALFSPEASSSGEEPWYDALVRWSTAVLLDRYLIVAF